MLTFTIFKSDFLTRNIIGYSHQYYTGYGQTDNPNFINTLKNTFNTENKSNLIAAREKVTNILIEDLQKIMKHSKLSSCICICVPRSKALNTYSNTQLYFKDAVRMATNRLNGVIDGTNFIVRTTNTYTTHLDKATRDGRIESNDGDKPYNGITINTCRIDRSRIQGQNIILVDDIYTKSINVDEDCIQALFDNGAKNIIFYSIGYTRRA